MSVWRIAAAVFVGNVVWSVIVFVLYFCFMFALASLSPGGGR